MTSVLGREFYTIEDVWGLKLAKQHTSVEARAADLEVTRAVIESRVCAYQLTQMSHGEEVATRLARANGRVKGLLDELGELTQRAQAGEEIDLTRWQTLDNQASHAAGAAENLRQRAEKVAGDLADPLASLADMERRMPALRRPIAEYRI